MSRGPKPPIAPKPRLTGPSEYLNNSLGKCSNGRLLCEDRGLYDGHHSTLNCLELEPDEQYIMVPRAPQKEDTPVDGATEEPGFERWCSSVRLALLSSPPTVACRLPAPCRCKRRHPP